MSSRILVISRKEIKELFRIKKNIAGLVFVFLLMFSISIYSVYAVIQGLPEALRPDVLRYLINASFLHYSLALMLFVAFGGVQDVFMGDKISKTLETLLTAPISFKEVLFGKTLAICIPATLLAFIYAPAAMIAINWMGGSFFWPELIVWIHLFFVVPLLGFSIIAIVGMVMCISRKLMSGNLIIFAIAFTLFFVTSAFAREMPAPEVIFILYAALAGILFLTSSIISGRVRKEKVILSV